MRTVTEPARPTLWRLARIDFDPVRNRPVLLYPEGAVLLNDTGAAILRLLDGRRTVADVVDALAAQYGAPDPAAREAIARDVDAYLADMAAKEFVRGL